MSIDLAETIAKPMELSPLGPAPLVSVIVANYNYGKYLRMLVNSLLDQSYCNWELIICDDGSTDGSQGILAALDNCDSRVRPLYKENGGQSSAWNLAFKHANGDIICLLDADDWYMPHKLATIVDAFRAHPDTGLVYHPLQPTDEPGTPIGRPIPQCLPSGWLFTTALKNGGRSFLTMTTMAFRSDLGNILFPIPVGLGNHGDAYIGQSSSFMTKILAVPEVLGFYRRHGYNHSGTGDYLDVSVMQTRVRMILSVQCHVRAFVSKWVNPETAAQIRLADSHWFWTLAATLYIFQSKPPGGIEGYQRETILAHITPAPKRVAWYVLMRLPCTVSKSLLRTWHKVRRLRGTLRRSSTRMEPPG